MRDLPKLLALSFFLALMMTIFQYLAQNNLQTKPNASLPHHIK